MIEESTTVKEELLLHDEDFPDNYVHMAHPDDYKEVSSFVPQFIMHEHFGRHNRLIVRAAWLVPKPPGEGKTSKNTFVPMSFVCNTGAPSHVYLSSKALSILSSKKLLLKDDRDTPYVNIHIDNISTFPATIEETPYVHRDANILGLKSLKKLSMRLRSDGFCFNDSFVYL